MTAYPPPFAAGVQWRRLGAAERRGTPWKYLLLRDVVFDFYPKITLARFVLRDVGGVERGTIAPLAVTVREGYAWNGCTASPDWELPASLPHDLLYQFSGVAGFPATVTRHWADNLFYALRTTPLGWAYRLGLFVGSWARWGQDPAGCTVTRINNP